MKMASEMSLALESNGLLDLMPTPPDSTEEDLSLDLDPIIPTASAAVSLGKRPASPAMSYGSPQPPDFDEEPSDFEDEVQGIMEREKRSLSKDLEWNLNDDMDMDTEEVGEPVASFKFESFFHVQLG